MRLGLFGGSFDPIHFGHLLLAESCREACALDQVWFVPAANPPHKLDRSMGSADDRLAMLKLAIAGHQAFDVSLIELERGGVSYTVDTLRAVTEMQPGVELHFLMGADSLADLPGWREPQTICTLATPVVARRAGSPEPDFSTLCEILSDERIEEIRAQQFEMPVIELSSTDLRERAMEGRSLRFRTPPAVAAYIHDKQLYRATE